MDFLISGSTHTVKKIVVHSNVARMISQTPCMLSHLCACSRARHYSNDINVALGKFRADQKTTRMVSCWTKAYIRYSPSTPQNHHRENVSLNELVASKRSSHGKVLTSFAIRWKRFSILLPLAKHRLR